jgi:hypothetical protein
VKATQMSAMPAEAEPVHGSSARPLPARPVTVQPPSQPGPFASDLYVPDPAVSNPDLPAPPPARPVSGRMRQTSVRSRKAGARSHPVGVRACSSVSSISRPGPATAALPATALPTTLPDTHAPATVVPLPRVPQADAPEAHPVRAGRPAQPSHLRLTRRGRSALVTSAVLIASLLWFAAATAAEASDHGARPGPADHSMSQIVVQPGQTLWSIAAQANPTADTRLVIQQILAANSLTNENLTAGQHLWVPAK